MFNSLIILLLLMRKVLCGEQTKEKDDYKFYISSVDEIERIDVSKIHIAYVDPRIQEIKKVFGNNIKIFNKMVDREVSLGLKVDIKEVRFKRNKEYLTLDLCNITQKYYSVNIKNLKDIKEIVYLKFFNEQFIFLFYLEIDPANIRKSINEPKFKTGNLNNIKDSKIMKHNKVTLNLKNEKRRIFIIGQDYEKVKLFGDAFEAYNIDLDIMKYYREIKTNFIRLFTGTDNFIKDHENFLKKYSNLYSLFIKKFKTFVFRFIIGISELRYSIIVNEDAFSDEVVFINGSSLKKYLDFIYDNFIKEIRISQNDLEQIEEFNSFQKSYEKMMDNLANHTKCIDSLIVNLFSRKRSSMEIISEKKENKESEIKKIKKFNENYFKDLIVFSETYIDRFFCLAQEKLITDTNFSELPCFISNVENQAKDTIIFRFIINLKYNQGYFSQNDLFSFQMFSDIKISWIVSTFQFLNEEPRQDFANNNNTELSRDDTSRNIAKTPNDVTKNDYGNITDKNSRENKYRLAILKKRKESCNNWENVFKKIKMNINYTLKDLMEDQIID